AFVLPHDVYPKPKPKKTSKKTVAAATSDMGAAVKISEAVGSNKVTVARPGVTDDASDTTVRNGATVRTARQEKAEAVREAVQTRGALVTPFRLIVLAVAGVISATGYFVWQAHMKAVADRALPTHVDAAETAMRERDIGAAAREYELASEAVDRLDRQDSES